MPTNPKLGVTAVFDDAEFERRLKRHLQQLKTLEDKIDDLADKATKSDSRRAASAKKANSAITRELRSLRWEMVTLLFFLRTFSRAFRALFQSMEESAQAAAQRMGIRALARRFETDLGGIADQIRKVNNDTLSLAESYDVVLKGMLQDQGQFSGEYARLWEAARVAAVVGISDAETAFESFIQDLVEGKGEITDAINPIYGLGRALEDYAASQGKTVEQLGQVEAAQVQLQAIYTTTNRLLNEGAGEALEAAASWDRLKKAWEDLKVVGGAIVDESGILAALTGVLRTAAQAATMLAAGLGAAWEELTKLGKVAGINQLAALTGLQVGLAQAGTPSDAFTRRMQRYSEAMGFFRDEVDKTRMDYERERLVPGDARGDMDLSPIVDHLMRREELIEDHNNRVENIEIRYRQRQQRIESQYNKSVARIQRSAQRSRDRAIRAYHRRLSREQAQHNARMRNMEKEHELRLEQNRREYQLRSIQSEALYQYERGLLVAYGDVLAIEDLDARYALEQEARKQNFQEQQRQERENFELQRSAAREMFEIQMAELRASLEDQLQEIAIQEEERLLEAQERRDEELLRAKEDYERQLELEEIQHQRSLKKWNEYWVKLARQFELGLGEIEAILREFFGESGELDAIMSDFIDKWNNYVDSLQRIQQVLGGIRQGFGGGAAAAVGGAGVPSGWFPNTPGGYAAYQYGGSTMVNRPTPFIAGEGGMPEMVSVRPLSPLANVSVSWAGGSIPVTGSGLEGADTSNIGDAIAQGLVVSLQKALVGSGATYA